MKRRTKVTWIIGVVLTIGCAAWYVWPLDADESWLPATGDASIDGAAMTGESVELPGAFDRSAYAAVNLWNPPPPPPPEVKATDDKPRRREIPLRLKLVAIMKTAESSGAAAAIYDPDTDNVLIVGEGDRINEHFSVQQITASGVELFDGNAIRVLELEDKSK